MPKLITIPEFLLKDILPHLNNTSLEKKIKGLINNTGKYRRGLFSHKFENQTQIITYKLARLGLAQVVIYQHKKPWIYQEQLLKAQDEAKKNKKCMVQFLHQGNQGQKVYQIFLY